MIPIEDIAKILGPEFLDALKLRDLSTEEYFKGNQFSIDAFNKKYTKFPGETYGQAIKRVCDFVASVEETEELRAYWSDRWQREILLDWWHPAGSIMQGAGSDKSISLANCFRRDTKFITNKGTKSFNDFEHGETVKVLNGRGAFVDATVKSYGQDTLYKLTISRNGITKEIFCTGNHSWRVFGEDKIVTKSTLELKENDSLPYIKRKWMPSNANNSRYICPVGVLHGLVFGDGHYDKSTETTTLTLCGDSKKLVELFKGFNWNIVSSGENIKITYLPKYFKNEMPDLERYNEEYVLGFLAGYFAADGSVDRFGRAYIACANSQVLEDLKKLIEPLGIYTSNIRLIRDKSPFDGNPNQKLYGLHLWKDCLFDEFFIKPSHKLKWQEGTQRVNNPKARLNWKVVLVEKTNQVEDVWCVEVPNDHNFTLESGVNTGNCTTISLGSLRTEEEWDNLESIIRNTGYTVAKTAAYRQGLGVDFSRIRPRGMKVENSSAESQGAIHWMRWIDQIGYFVGQKGRIPAMLFSLNVSHPDIEEFIDVKKDYTLIQNANISVHATNAFYEAVERDDDWTLVFEIPEVKKGQKVYVDVHSSLMDYGKDEKGLYYIAARDRKAETITKVVKARHILELIAKRMTANAEPGIQNIDIARDLSNSDYVYDPNHEYDSRIISTNACCLLGNTPVLTKTGYRTIEDIHTAIKAGEDIVVYSYNIKEQKFEWQPITNSWQQRNDKTVTLEIQDGPTIRTITCSEDHPILTSNRGYVQAIDLNEDDDIVSVEEE